MNAMRTSHGLAPLNVDSTLVRAARSHSVDMLRHQYFAHGALGPRVTSFHVRGPVFGENLAWGSAATSQWVVNQWMASPAHRANLLRPGFRRIGIGEVRGAFAGPAGATVVTADFAGT